MAVFTLPAFDFFVDDAELFVEMGRFLIGGVDGGQLDRVPLPVPYPGGHSLLGNLDRVSYLLLCSGGIEIKITCQRFCAVLFKRHSL